VLFELSFGAVRTNDDNTLARVIVLQPKVGPPSARFLVRRAALVALHRSEDTGWHVRRESRLLTPWPFWSWWLVSSGEQRFGGHCPKCVRAVPEDTTYDCTSIAYFKMVDEKGYLCFPDVHQLGLDVLVRVERNTAGYQD
jgi:hypothetical protein